MEDQTKIRPCPSCSDQNPRVMDFKMVQDDIKAIYQVACTEKKCGMNGPREESKSAAIKAWNDLSVAQTRADRARDVVQHRDRYLPDMPWTVVPSPHGTALRVFPSGDEQGDIYIAEVPGDSDRSYRVAYLIAAIPDLLAQLVENRNFFLAEAEYYDTREEHPQALFRRAAANDVETTWKKIFEDLDIDRINLSVDA